MAAFKKNVFIMLILLTIFSEIASASSTGALTIKTDGLSELQNQVAIIKISPKSMILYRGGCMQFVVSAFDSKGKRVPFAMHWEIKSDIPDFGILDKSDGDKVVFNAVNAGRGALVAVSGEIRAEIPVEIRKSGR